MRIDLYIAKKEGISRNRAQFLIDQGLVRVDGRVIQKSSIIISPGDDVTIAQDSRRLWVSRSAVKLADFLITHDISVS